MAASITVEFVLQTISEGHLECQICADRYKEPKLLECSHSFCLECLQQLAERETPPAQILICPVCRVETRLSGNGVADLRADFKTISMVDQINKLEGQQQNRRPVSECSKHAGKDMIMYCETCHTLICTTCIAQDHIMHSVTELNKALHKCRQQVKEELAKVRQSVNTFDIARQDIAMSRETLDVMFASTKDRISKKANEEIAKAVARIESEKQTLIQEAEHIYEVRVKTFQTAQATNIEVVREAQHKQDELSKIIQGECNEMVGLIEELLQDLKKYTEMQPSKVPDALAFMDFKEGHKSLGRLVLKPVDEQQSVPEPLTYRKRTWTLKDEMRTCVKGVAEMTHFSPSDVAAYSNGDIVVADFQNRRLMTVTGNPRFTPKVQPIKGLSRPKRVTVNKNDELIVLEGTCSVKIFNRKYRLLHQFTPGGWPSNIPSWIAVDNNNLIAAGHCSDREDVVSLYSANGSIARTIPVRGIGKNVTFYKRQLVYTTADAKNLISVDYSGGVVFTVDINFSGLPSALCCDKDGSIYVAVTEGSSGEIHHYSPNGHHLGCIIQRCNNPHSITVTPAGHLVVAADESVQIYHRE